MVFLVVLLTASVVANVVLIQTALQLRRQIEDCREVVNRWERIAKDWQTNAAKWRHLFNMLRAAIREERTARECFVGPYEPSRN